MPRFDKVVGHALRDVCAGGHERATHRWIVEEVARLMGLPCAGILERAQADPRAFHVPDDTLTAQQARALGIAGGEQVLGGVVPHAFLATKVISHPLVEDDAASPPGWNQALARALEAATLPGHAVFCASDARRAHARLAETGAVRFKLPSGIGGRGQWLVEDGAALERILRELPAEYLATQGAVLERNLRGPVTYSVGELRCAGIDIAYHGTQCAVADDEGCAVYGGSRLWIVRGTLDELAASGLSAPQRRVVEKAHVYDRFIVDAYPDLHVSRRNYDVVLDDEGACGVLEQSWRVGGATPAELAAVEAFLRDPGLRRLQASTHESYGDAQPPAGAQVYYQAPAPGNGPRFKYRTSSF
ncbi:MAG TPA: DUF3182 domain-containing protein [Xanthomonadaceae bacterium]|nr:DUF3182 domain-containing protein [Xanthomonadaceae bacterium]